jgi:hypothetical protein
MLLSICKQGVIMGEFSQNGESQQSPEERRREKINKNVHELARRKEAQEISESDFGAEGIYYLQAEGKPITKSEVGNSAVVLSQEEFDSLGYIDIVFENGQLATIESENTGYSPEDLFIIFPEELGDIEEA